MLTLTAIILDQISKFQQLMHYFFIVVLVISSLNNRQKGNETLMELK